MKMLTLFLAFFLVAPAFAGDSLLKPGYDPGIWGGKVCNVLAPKGHNQLAKEVGEKLEKLLPPGSPFVIVNVRITNVEKEKEIVLWFGRFGRTGMLWISGSREEVTGEYLRRAVRAMVTQPLVKR